MPYRIMFQGDPVCEFNTEDEVLDWLAANALSGPDVIRTNGRAFLRSQGSYSCSPKQFLFNRPGLLRAERFNYPNNPRSNTMNKQQALTELAALKERADALEKIINAPEPTPSLLDKPEPGSGQPYYAHGSIFADRATAEAYAEAIDTLLLLRHQPGTVAALQSVDQWLIDPQTGSLYPRSSAWPRSDTKATRLSPCFETWEAAEAAIKAIGADRIMRMFKTFHHIKG